MCLPIILGNQKRFGERQFSGHAFTLSVWRIYARALMATEHPTVEQNPLLPNKSINSALLIDSYVRDFFCNLEDALTARL